MALSSPCGFPLDEDEDVAVFESTAAELASGAARPRLPEISVISPGTAAPPTREEQKPVVPPAADHEEKVKVFLRIRPLTAAERERGEEQGAVGVQDEETLLLKAPKDSQSLKSAERGIAPSVHRFSFSKIFGPETSQQEFYENTMKTMVKDVLLGQNRLLYTYGVTNSGKTYTVQGSGREAGLLPRALSSMFRSLQGRLYGPADLKPVMHQEVRHLQPGEVRAEEVRRRSLLREDEGNATRRVGTTSIWDSGVGGVSSSSSTSAAQLEDSSSVCLDPDSLCHLDGVHLEAGLQFSVWVSFYEIYNEFLYDLLDAAPTATPRKRVTLRLADDRQGNPFVKDLSWVQVCSAEEAWRILRVGQKNQSFASTHLNQNSSRSHSIFSIRLLHIQPEGDSGRPTNISELTVCDLAGSERCKQQRSGERMKEATNINTSLLTLGRCITALRSNQNNRSRPPLVVPFRDSKLTRVLQGFFCGGGASVMVVNINTCSSVYDETLQALKFSAIATQLVHGPSTKTRVAYILSLLRDPAAAAGNDSTVMEDEEEEEEESELEDGDVTMLNTESLLRAIDVLKREVQRQRGEREALEEQLREQVVSEMMEVINGMQDGFSESLEAERALVEQRYEDKISNLQKHLKLFYSEELKERDQEIESLSAALNKQNAAAAPAEEPAGPRRSVRLNTQTEVAKLRSDLERCRAELDAKTQEVVKLQTQLVVPGPSGSLANTADRKLEEGQRNLRLLRSDLQRLGGALQAGGRAFCHNTGAERLRHALTAADHTLGKQDQVLAELLNVLTLVRSDLRRKAELLSLSGHVTSSSTTPSSCKKRGCGTPGDSENRPPTKRPFFQPLFPRYATRRAAEDANATPYTHILRSRQPSPPRSPAPSTPRPLRGKY